MIHLSFKSKKSYESVGLYRAPNFFRRTHFINQMISSTSMTGFSETLLTLRVVKHALMAMIVSIVWFLLLALSSIQLYAILHAHGTVSDYANGTMYVPIVHKNGYNFEKSHFEKSHVRFVSVSTLVVLLFAGCLYHFSTSQNILTLPRDSSHWYVLNFSLVYLNPKLRITIV